MKYYSIGEICSLLELKPHNVRYWEQEFPFIKPKRSLVGRRLYSEREVQILFRIKYLLQVKNCSIEEATKVIWDEIKTDNMELKMNVRQLRGELLDLLDRLPLKKKSGTRKTQSDNKTGAGR